MKRVIRHGSLVAALLAMLVPSARADDLWDIFTLAAERDPEIREARARYNSTHTTIAQGLSQLLPNMTLTGNTSRDTTGPTVPTQFGPAHSFARGFNTKGYGLSLRQNLMNFQAWYSFNAARNTDRMAATQLAQSEQQLILRVATAYFDILRTQDNLNTFRAEEEAALSILEQTRERFEVGLVAITDVYDSQANYDLARVNRLVEENNLEQSMEALEAITGRNHRLIEPLREDFPIESADPSSLEEWVNIAEENNLAIIAAAFQLEAMRDEAKAATSAMLPTMEIAAGYNWAQSGNPLSFTPNLAVERTNITLNFSMPLYTGGLNSSRKRQAYYNRDASEEVLLRTRREGVQSTRNNYRNVETDVIAVQARAQAVISAQSALEATEIGAEVGTRNIVDIVLAQRTLFQARRDYANARYNYIINTLNLKQAAGILSPQDVIDLNEWLD